MAFKRSMTVYELILNEILRSFVQIAKLKDEELDDHADRFELFRMNDQAFQSIVSRSMNNVFKKIVPKHGKDQIKGYASLSETQIY